MNTTSRLLTSFELFIGTELSRKNRKPAKKKQDPDGYKRRKLKLAAENQAAASIINKRKIQENKQKYKKLYDAFFKRGGGAWYESLTGLAFDEKRIYLDIDYFESVLELGCEIELIEEKSNVVRTKNRLDRQRLFNKYYYDHSDQPISRRVLMMGYACPGWANMSKLKQVYIERDKITQSTGVPHHVDHIVPICGDKVCGLHNEFNVRVITKAENLKKSNKFTVY